MAFNLRRVFLHPAFQNDARHPDGLQTRRVMLTLATFLNTGFFTVCLLLGSADPADASSSRYRDWTRLTLTATHAGVVVRYDLAKSVTELRLGTPNSMPASAAVSTGDARLVYRDGVITSPEPFTRATLLLAPDRKEEDSRYPLITAIAGRGFVVYVPHLLPPSEPVRLTLADSTGTRRLNRDARNGYVVVTTAKSGRWDGPLLAARGTPHSVEELVASRTRELLRFYSSAVGQPPVSRPRIILSAVESREADAGNRGDLAANGVMLLRVRYSPEELGTPAFEERLSTFLAHEIFHLWNWNNKGDESTWWVHEGGAEYASWLAASKFWAGGQTLEQRVSAALSACVLALGERPLRGLTGASARSTRYPCGAVIHWLVDAGARMHKPGSTALSVTRTLGGSRTGYTEADLERELEVAAPGAAELIRLILDGRGAERWNVVGKMAAPLGAKVVLQAPAPFLRRVESMKPLLLSACGQINGVGEADQELYVVGPQACATFPGRVNVLSVDGISPMQEPSELFDTVSKRCQSADTLTLAVEKDDRRSEAKVKCTVRAVAPPPSFAVTRALP